MLNANRPTEALAGFDFRNLFVLDLANNHQGSREHGLRVVREIGQVVRAAGARAALKFQFRQLDSFIHPEHQTGSEHKQVKRFMGTRLSMEDFDVLLEEVRRQSMVTMCTPFDEASVDVICQRDYDVIKVASCSARDWPLLEKVAEAGKPVIASTGGLKLSEIDDLVSFFEHRGVDFAIMHCVAVYPTPDPDFHLNQLDILLRRYPTRHCGWSTHELPDDLAPVQIAVAKRATLFERHVGVPTEQQPLNAYSSSPEQVGKWIAASQRAQLLCGEEGPGHEIAAEIESLNSLKRGVYVARPIAAGERLDRADVYFAIPYEPGQLESGKFKNGLVAGTEIAADRPILEDAVGRQANPDRLVLQAAIHEAKAMLNEANIALNSEFRTEYSHHYGIQNFRQTGAIIIDCVNRNYCKKLIVQLPGQSHPLHFHKLKEETFQVLSGAMRVEIEGHHKTLRAGETLLIQPGVWHRFWTETGVIFEEISTTHFNTDSYYRDKRINRMAREERKTAVDHWGRFQLGSDQVTPDAETEPPSEPAATENGPPHRVPAPSRRIRSKSIKARQ